VKSENKKLVFGISKKTHVLETIQNLPKNYVLNFIHTDLKILRKNALQILPRQQATFIQIQHKKSHQVAFALIIKLKDFTKSRNIYLQNPFG